MQKISTSDAIYLAYVNAPEKLEVLVKEAYAYKDREKEDEEIQNTSIDTRRPS